GALPPGRRARSIAPGQRSRSLPDAHGPSPREVVDAAADAAGLAHAAERSPAAEHARAPGAAFPRRRRQRPQGPAALGAAELARALARALGDAAEPTRADAAADAVEHPAE